MYACALWGIAVCVRALESSVKELFVNLANHPELDALGFPPVGHVTSGFNDVVLRLYGGYGEMQDACRFHNFTPCDGPTTRVRRRARRACSRSVSTAQPCQLSLALAPRPLTLNPSRVALSVCWVPRLLGLLLPQEVYLKGNAWLDQPNHFPALTQLVSAAVVAEYTGVGVDLEAAPSSSLIVALVVFGALLVAGLALFALATPLATPRAVRQACRARCLGLCCSGPYAPMAPPRTTARNPLAPRAAAVRRGGAGPPRARSEWPTEGSISPPGSPEGSPEGERGAFEFEMTSPGSGLVII